MNARFKGFGLGKRKSAVQIQDSGAVTPSPTPPPGHLAPQQHQLGVPAHANSPPLVTSSSSSSLPMHHPVAGNRPPSYTGPYPQGTPGVPIDRNSPLANQGHNRSPPTQMAGGPPPINTGVPGYPPNMAAMGQQQPMGGQQGFGGNAGYPPGAPPPAGGPMAGQYHRGSAAEVEGTGRKAQLIVGIDFVSRCLVLLLQLQSIVVADLSDHL